jgi:hypothetical protein
MFISGGAFEVLNNNLSKIDDEFYKCTSCISDRA